MIHGAGSYQSDFTYGDSDGITMQDQLFYAPNLDMYCNNTKGEYTFLTWVSK